MRASREDAVKVYVASDHAGFETRNRLVAYVRDALGYDVEDCGAHMNDPNDDYPQIIAVAARKLSDDVAAGAFRACRRSRN